MVGTIVMCLLRVRTLRVVSNVCAQLVTQGMAQSVTHSVGSRSVGHHVQLHVAGAAGLAVSAAITVDHMCQMANVIGATNQIRVIRVKNKHAQSGITVIGLNARVVVVPDKRQGEFRILYSVFYKFQIDRMVQRRN